MASTIEIFCCYAHEDQSFLVALKKHLKPLGHSGLIVVQDDVSPGEDWEQKTSHYLNTAHIILLLVSADFIASKYYYEFGMRQALERHKEGKACVIPIILRPVHFQRTPFGKLQPLPTSAQPITTWSNQEEAWLDVISGIEKVIEKLLCQLFPRMIALFGYETQGGSTSVFCTNPSAFSLNGTTYLEWLETKKDFTERDIVDHIWVKAGDSGNCYVIHFHHDGQFDENSLLYSSKQLQGSWQLVDGALRMIIESDENGTLVKYELDISANKNGPIHSGIEFSSMGTGPNYFVFLPSQQSTTEYLEEALTAFNQLLDVNQNCVEAYKTKGYLLRDLGRYEEALDTYQQTVEMKPDYMWAWYDLGDLFHKLRRFDEALAAFDHAIALDHRNAWAWYEKGQTFYDLKRYKEALTAYDQATQIDANNAWFWHRKGETLRELKQYTEALISYEQALQKDPRFANPHNGKGNVLYRNLKRYEEALAAYQQAIELRPNYMWAWHNLGNVLHELRRFEEALNAYKRTTEIDSSYFWAWQNMGAVLHELGRHEEALDAFAQAIKLDGHIAVAWREKGKTLQDLERYEEALGSYERALELESRYASIWTRIGQVLRMLKRYEEAITAYDQALQLDPNSVDVYLGKGRVYLDLEHYNDALDIYEQATNIAPSHTWTWHDKGVALGNLQRAEEAVEAFEHAIKLDPENTWAWLHKAETLTYLARQAYKRAGQTGREPLKREYYNLVQKATGKCLDGNGSIVYMHPPNGGRFQLWKAVEVSPNTIILKHFQSGKVLEATVERGTYLSEYNDSPSQQWIPEDAGDGYQKLRQVATGMLLHGDTNNDVYLQPNGGDFQIWRVMNIQITSLIAPNDSSNTSELLVFEQ